MTQFFKFLLIVFASVFIDAHTFEDCGSTTFYTSTLTISPDPAIAGKDVSVIIVGNLEGNRFPATIDTTIQYGSYPYMMTDKFCDLDVYGCTKVNEVTLKKTMELPRITASGTYEAKIVMYNSDESIAGCVQASVKVK